MEPFDLSGRVAIVTGGNGGIGLGMAEGLAKAGAAVVVAGAQPAENRGGGGGAGGARRGERVHRARCAERDSCRDMVRRRVERFGRLDILVNNAGMSIRKPPQDYDVAEWHRCSTPT